MPKRLPCTIHLSAILLMLSDLLVFAVSIAIPAMMMDKPGDATPEVYLRLLLLLPGVLLIYGGAGLYQGAAIFPGAALGPAEELRRLVYATVVVFLVSAMFCFFLEPRGPNYSRRVIGSAGLAWLILIPAARFGLRKLLSHFNRWGIPAVLVGDGALCRRVMNTLRTHLEYGINPIGYVADHASLPGFRHLGTPDKLLEIARGMGISYGIFIVQTNGGKVAQILSRYGDHFRHLLIVEESHFSSAACIQPKDLGGILGLEVHQNLLAPGLRLIKAVSDYTLALLLFIFLSPLFLFLSVMVTLDSRGPVFFTQERIGRGGRPFRILKFRTMRQGADAKLDQLLGQATDLNKEWTASQKLKHDPRITRCGGFLRKTSLDELPQLWNILRGQMTLVGPRPITQTEIYRYGEGFNLYKKVRPGLTGLWQVSGRSELSYEERVMLDARYISNWTPWLDLYILLKTVYAVLGRKGAI